MSGSVYRHYKGGLYKLLLVVKDEAVPQRPSTSSQWKRAP